MSNLFILGAAYGPVDVTPKVRSLVSDDTLSVTANNSTFGDTWSGHDKSLVVVYQYEGQAPQTKVVAEGKTLTISEGTGTPWTPPEPGTLCILGAAYGLGDVTDTARGKVSGNTLSVTANNATWGDQWRGNDKTLVVVYQYGELSLIQIAKENDKLFIQDTPPLRILGAAYGRADVTAKVTSLVVNGGLSVTANNSTFGDSWRGTDKSLVVVYQYGAEQVQVAIAAEDKTLSLQYSKQAHERDSTDPSQLLILGAAYGLGNVTAKASQLVRDNALSVTANNSTFGDQWSGHDKSLVVVYQYGPGPARMRIVTEGEPLSIQKQVSPYPGLISVNGLLDTGDVINFSASNNQYLTCDAERRLVAISETPTTGCTLTVEMATGGFLLKTDGKYVQRGAADQLYATGNTPAEGTVFTISAALDGTLRIASVDTARFWRLSTEDNSIAVDTESYFSMVSSFDVGIQKVHPEQLLARRSLDASLLQAASLDPCQLAWAEFVWQLTGGFFLAIGLGPYIATGQVKTGVLGLLQSNSRVWSAITALVDVLKTQKTITAGAAVSVIGVIYSEGLLWDVLKLVLSFAGWLGLARAISKILEVVFLPELEAADLLASFIVWSTQTTLAGLRVSSACPVQRPAQAA